MGPLERHASSDTEGICKQRCLASKAFDERYLNVLNNEQGHAGNFDTMSSTEREDHGKIFPVPQF